MTTLKTQIFTILFMVATTTNHQRTTVDSNHKSREKRLRQAVAQKEGDTSQYHQLKHDNYIF